MRIKERSLLLLLLLYHVVMGQCSNRLWGGQNVVRTLVTRSVPLFYSYDILTSSVIYKCTDAREHGI